MPRLRVALCQVNTTVGDLAGNVETVLAAYREVVAADADLAVFPEMTITGYPPEDLVLKPGFVHDSRHALASIAAATGGCAAVVGFADGDATGVFNAAALCANGRVAATYHKRELPNYAVFDEMRTFRPGAEPLELHEVAGTVIGITICEDLWIPGGPVRQLGVGGAELIVNINGSPYHQGKIHTRRELLRQQVAETGCPILYLNLVGGQDELVFDGGSMVVDERGEVVVQARQFVEEVVIADLDLPSRTHDHAAFPRVEVTPPSPGARTHRPPLRAPILDPLPELYEALVLATRDYVGKSGFTDVCIGLSGGIDSSLTAAVAVDALGPDHVHGVLLPSRYSSDHSITDAEKLAAALGIDHRIVPIEPAHAAFMDMLTPALADQAGGLTEENVQSRIRGVVLMALANAFGWLVLTTGNKSEAAVGYSTLYGDTAGAYAVIKDVYKLTVYELALHVNGRAGGPVIPADVLVKAPSAELRPGQRDDQSLPRYEVLDPVLEAYIEGDRTLAELIELGVDPALAERITLLVDRNEYKRRQTPLGPRVTTKSFGRDRRLPIVNRYRRWP